MKYLYTTFILFFISFLTGCATNTITIDNNVPKTKVVFERNPDQSVFYSDTYKTISQRLYSDNVQVGNLVTGNNKITLDDDQKYAVYFILPDFKKQNDSNWKFLISTNKSNTFIINQDNIIKT